MSQVHSEFEFLFTPDSQRCFAFVGFTGTVAKVDVTTGKFLRALDMSPYDDGGTSPSFPPDQYSGSVVGSGEFLFADFGGSKHGGPTPGGIWKYGSNLSEPIQLLRVPEDESSRIHALCFAGDRVYVVKTDQEMSQLALYDGEQLIDIQFL